MSDNRSMEVYLLLKGINLFIYESYGECRTKKARRELADFSILLGAAMFRAREDMVDFVPTRQKRLELAVQMAKNLARRINERHQHGND